VDPGDRQPLADLGSANDDDSDNYEESESFQHDHLDSPILKFAGKSPVPSSFPSSTFFALVLFLKLKSVAATSFPVFQSLI
jgi:hypothetical protein